MPSNVYSDLLKELNEIVMDYEYFIENILGVGEENIQGHQIRVYSIKVKYTEFMEKKEELLTEIEKFRLTLMNRIPSAFEIHSRYMLDIEDSIANIKDEGKIDDPLNIKMALNLLAERIKTAVKLGDVERLLSEPFSSDQIVVKIFKDAIKKVAKTEKAYIVFDALIRNSSRGNPLGVFELSTILKRNPTWVKSALKTIRDEAPEILRITLVKGEYKYYIPDVYKRYYIV